MFRIYVNVKKKKKKKKAIKERNPNWQEKTMMTYLSFLHQNGLDSKMLFIPKVDINSVCSVANMATRVLIHQCWSSPAIL